MSVSARRVQDTSIESFYSSDFSTQELVVQNALIELEAASIRMISFFTGIDRASVSARLNGLKSKGLVVHSFKAPCIWTKKRVIHWRAL